MKVHLLKMLDYSNGVHTEVLQLLQGTGIGLQFQEGDWEGVEEAEIPLLFSFEDIWELCNDYRTKKQVAREDFVVLLTPRPNEHNYFSYFDKEDLNAFVHTDDWDYFGIGNTIYPIAYEVAANVLQRLMHLNDAHIHKGSIGCMNDMCEYKKDVLLKLRTADICPDCLEEIERQGVSETVVNQVLNIFEKVRSELMWVQGFKRNVKLQVVEVMPDGKIRIGGKNIRLGPIPCMLMIFFLKHPKGVEVNELYKYWQELFDIYQVVKREKVDKEKAVKTINDIAQPYSSPEKPASPLFPKYLSDYHRVIRTIGAPLCKFYEIERNKVDYKFKMNIFKQNNVNDLIKIYL